MEVTSIQNGIIIDHVPAGTSLKVLEYLKIDPAKTKLALIMNADSHLYGTKDIIKIEGGLDVVDLDMLGYIDHNITVNIIRDDRIVEKKALKLPKKIVNVIHCKNPRCITSIEQELPHIFYLADEKSETYRCQYCEEKYSEYK